MAECSWCKKKLGFLGGCATSFGPLCSECNTLGERAKSGDAEAQKMLMKYLDTTSSYAKAELNKILEVKTETTPQTIPHKDNSASDSQIGVILKALSIIVGILTAIGSVLIMVEADFIIGFAVLLISIISSCLTFGIGEIVCLLTSINNRIK